MLNLAEQALGSSNLIVGDDPRIALTESNRDLQVAMLYAQIASAASLIAISKTLNHIADHGIPKNRSGRIN